MGNYKCKDDFTNSLMIHSYGDNLFLLRQNRQLEIFNYKDKKVYKYKQITNRCREVQYRIQSKGWSQLQYLYEESDCDLSAFLFAHTHV